MNIDEAQKLRDVLREIKDLAEGLPTADALADLQTQVADIRDSLGAIPSLVKEVPDLSELADLDDQVGRISSGLPRIRAIL